MAGKPQEASSTAVPTSQGTHTTRTSPHTDPNSSPIQSNEIFDEEIAQVRYLKELFEFELANYSPVNVKVNLRRNLDFWKVIGTSPFILNVIERGYMLPFESLPDPAMFKNNSSSISHAQFVEEAINELCKSGRVIETSEPPLVVNPLSVSVQANGKRRLILDLRHVNKYLT